MDLLAFEILIDEFGLKNNLRGNTKRRTILYLED